VDAEAKPKAASGNLVFVQSCQSLQYVQNIPQYGNTVKSHYPKTWGLVNTN